MSTKSTLYLSEQEYGGHKLNIHIFKEMHESNDTVVVEFYCNTCYCSYKFTMAKHLGEQLVQLLCQTMK